MKYNTKNFILITTYLILSFFVIGLVLVFTVLFPLKYKNEIINYSSKYNLSQVLVASVINCESGFNNTAVSNSGALGLMQILPSTANEIADKLSIKNFDNQKILNTDINIAMGCYYLRYLLDYYDQNEVNALCAYNAGLNTVNNWLNNIEYSKNGVNLDVIPYKETSDYISKIKFSKFIYSAIFK